jgi:hypothetical protein
LASCRLIQAKGPDLGGIRWWSQIVRPTKITAAGQRQGGYITAEDADRGERDHGRRPLGLTELDHPQAHERLANQIATGPDRHDIHGTCIVAGPAATPGLLLELAADRQQKPGSSRPEPQRERPNGLARCAR